MKRVLTCCSMPEWFIIPAIGIMDMRARGSFDSYKYRIGFAWLCFRLSVGIMKARWRLSGAELIFGKEQ